MILRIAWRNLWRHSWRTLLTLLAIAFASAVLVFFIGLQLSSYDAAINASVSVYHGYLQVQPEGYLDKPRIRTTLKQPRELREQVASLEGVRSAAIRAQGFALVSSEDRTYGVQIVGVEPQLEANVSTIPGLVTDGEYLASADALEAVVGKDLAKNLRIKVGDSLTVLGQGRDGSLAATILDVVGIFGSGAQDIDRSMVHVPLAAFQETFFMGQDAHAIVVKAEHLSIVDTLQRKATALLQGRGKKEVALRWDELVPGLKQSIELDFASGWLFYISLVMIVTFSVVNTFFMVVMERTREFCIMMSLGMRPGLIGRLVIVESVLLSLFGTVLGIGLGALVLAYYGVHGFTVPGMEEVAKLWNLPDAIYPAITFDALTSGPMVILLMATIASIVPALRILRLQPTEGIRSV